MAEIEVFYRGARVPSRFWHFDFYNREGIQVFKEGVDAALGSEPEEPIENPRESLEDIDGDTWYRMDDGYFYLGRTGIHEAGERFTGSLNGEPRLFARKTREEAKAGRS